MRGCNGAPNKNIFRKLLTVSLKHPLVNKAVLTVKQFAGKAKEYIREYDMPVPILAD